MDNINILELASSIRKEGYEGEYVDRLSSSDKNWVGVTNEVVLNGIIEFLRKLME